jgi:hypothetical protein
MLGCVCRRSAKSSRHFTREEPLHLPRGAAEETASRRPRVRSLRFDEVIHTFLDGRHEIAPTELPQTGQGLFETGARLITLDAHRADLAVGDGPVHRRPRVRQDSRRYNQKSMRPFDLQRLLRTEMTSSPMSAQINSCVRSRPLAPRHDHVALGSWAGR